MKLTTLSIERDTHLTRVVSFLERERPDIVCLQEVFERDVPTLARAASGACRFAPMTRFSHEGSEDHGEVLGVAIFSKYSIARFETTYYYGGEGALPLHREEERDSVWQPLLVVEVAAPWGSLRVGTTHFMKSPHGAPDDYQRARLPLLLSALARYDSLVACGDFNIPRSTELYHVLRGRYRDNVPAHLDSSLDSELHRVKGLRYMIDYLWSTDDLTVEGVAMTCGISDHCALSGTVVCRTGAHAERGGVEELERAV